jgi:isochorismate synthase
MKDFLIHRFPGEKLKTYVGEWFLCAINDLPEEVFFVSDFSKNNCFYFLPSCDSEFSSSKVTELLNLYEDSKRNVIDKNTYISILEEFKSSFVNYGVEKAIFSRVIPCDISESIDWMFFINNLSVAYPKTCVYLLGSEKFGVWSGATPEVLLSGGEASLSTMALAGTKWKEEDEWTDKEFHEQGLVKDYVYSILNEYNLKHLNVRPLETVSAGPVYHLCNYFNFELDKEYWNSLIDKLHPTPAVAGLPLDNALKLIDKFETHQRFFYTGLIGYKGANEIKIYVNLRCMEVFMDKVLLYVGGGITQGSFPESEWDETENKARTLIQILSK